MTITSESIIVLFLAVVGLVTTAMTYYYLDASKRLRECVERVDVLTAPRSLPASPVMSFDGTGYAKVNLGLIYDGVNLTLNLDVKTTATSGTIVFFYQRSQYFWLRLVGGVPTITADVGNGPVTITATAAIDDNSWHAISIIYRRTIVSVSLDNSNRVIGTVPGQSAYSSVDTIYVGGAPKSVTRGQAIQPLVGCVTSIVVNDTPSRDLTITTEGGVRDFCAA